jgi:alkylation response protein AidB-like acyl-CoA dehydrogenase
MWNILQSDDERMIADSVREFLTAELPLDRLRPKAVPVDADAVRRAMAGLGWFSVGLPEKAGGAGLGLVEEMLIQRELGRQVAGISTLATVLAAHVALAAGDEQLAGEQASGANSVGLAMVAADATGVAPAYAFDWSEGNRLVCWTGQGIGLFGPEAMADARAEECLDESVTLHTGKLSLDKALHWVDDPALLARVRVLVAALLVGLAEQACELTVEYAKIREQFGQPIGAFQAVKHRAADMGVRARLAWYQTCVACLKVAAGAEDAALQVDSALLLAAEAAHENGRAGIQLHGAIGFQSECDIHWFMKRAHIYDQLAGGRIVMARKVLAYGGE